jgi:hypothetical protein
MTVAIHTAHRKGARGHINPTLLRLSYLESFAHQDWINAIEAVGYEQSNGDH